MIHLWPALCNCYPTQLFSLISSDPLVLAPGRLDSRVISQIRGTLSPVGVSSCHPLYSGFKARGFSDACGFSFQRFAEVSWTHTRSALGPHVVPTAQLSKPAPLHHSWGPGPQPGESTTGDAGTTRAPPPSASSPLPRAPGAAPQHRRPRSDLSPAHLLVQGRCGSLPQGSPPKPEVALEKRKSRPGLARRCRGRALPQAPTLPPAGLKGGLILRRRTPCRRPGGLVLGLRPSGRRSCGRSTPGGPRPVVTRDSPGCPRERLSAR